MPVHQDLYQRATMSYFLTFHTVDPCMTFDPGNALVFGQGCFLPNFDGHRAFLKQLDLCMTFDLWSGRFKNMLSNLVGLSPTTMPSFSSIPQSTAKRIALIHTGLDILVVYRYGTSRMLLIIDLRYRLNQALTFYILYKENLCNYVSDCDGV